MGCDAPCSLRAERASRRSARSWTRRSADGTQPLEQVVLHYGARTADLLIYRGARRRLRCTIPGFRTHYHVETGPLEDSSVRHGRLDPKEIVAGLGDIRETAFYLSGPKAMIDTFRSRLTDECGVASERVLVDAWE